MGARSVTPRGRDIQPNSRLVGPGCWQRDSGQRWAESSRQQGWALYGPPGGQAQRVTACPGISNSVSNTRAVASRARPRHSSSGYPRCGRRFGRAADGTMTAGGSPSPASGPGARIPSAPTSPRAATSFHRAPGEGGACRPCGAGPGFRIVHRAPSVFSAPAQAPRRLSPVHRFRGTGR